MAHGITTQETPTGARPAAQVEPGLPTYVGNAPINATADLTNIHKPKLITSEAEFVTHFGPIPRDQAIGSSGLAGWTLLEAAKSHFRVYGVGPIVCINVIDPEDADHVASATAELHQLVDGAVKLQPYTSPDLPIIGVLADTVVVKNHNGTTTYVEDTDYTLAFDADGYLVVSTISDGDIADDAVLSVTFDYLDPSGVTNADIIGGYNGVTGVYTGLEVVEQVVPQLKKVPGLIVVPQYSQEPTVAARMAAIAASINETFSCLALTDLSTDAGDIATYDDAAAWKSDNGYTSKYQVALWPKVKWGDDVYHASTVEACRINLTDSENAGIPYVSPSNKPVSVSATVLDDGTELFLTKPQADTLNEAGICTFRNGLGGWVTWGNRTAAYPTNTDPKDMWIPIRRMFNWLAARVVLTHDRDVDNPINRRLVQLVLNTLTGLINSLVTSGALFDGSKIEFLASDNPTTDLADGKAKWRLTIAPPPPGENLVFIFEYDPELITSLFST